MLLQLWNEIQNNRPDEAAKQLGQESGLSEYERNIVKLLEAEIALLRQDYIAVANLAKEAKEYFSARAQTLKDLERDLSGLGVSFLERCWAYWLLARACAGECNWSDSRSYAMKAMKEWEFYQLSRRPFIHMEHETVFKGFENKIRNHLKVLRSILRVKPRKFEILDMLVPDNFQPQKMTDKANGITTENPFVSVCIPSYCDGPWLQKTVDAVLENAGYEHYEIVIVYQKKHPEDSLEPFLEDAAYKNHPKLNVFVYETPLGTEKSKEVSYSHSRGEMIISMDAHVIPCINFIKETVRIFCENSEVSILTYGFVGTRDDETLHGFYFNEVPYELNAIVGHGLCKSLELIYHKPRLYIRTALMGACFCMTRRLFEEVGGYLLKNYSWGDKSLGMNAYLYGYQIFASPDLICIHKWHENLYYPWRDTHRKTPRFEYENEIPSSALVIGYFYFSREYFEGFYVPWVKHLCGEAFEYHWKKFEGYFPMLEERKARFWKGAVRSVREYWIEYWDFIWNHLNEAERKNLTRHFQNQ